MKKALLFGMVSLAIVAFVSCTTTPDESTVTTSQVDALIETLDETPDASDNAVDESTNDSTVVE